MSCLELEGNEGAGIKWLLWQLRGRLLLDNAVSTVDESLETTGRVPYQVRLLLIDYHIKLVTDESIIATSLLAKV